MHASADEAGGREGCGGKARSCGPHQLVGVHGSQAAASILALLPAAQHQERGGELLGESCLQACTGSCLGKPCCKQPRRPTC